MKKITLSLALILSVFGAYAQIILQQDFTTTPTGYKMFNVDGVTRDCSFMNGAVMANGWVIHGGMVKGCSEQGTGVNDWFVTPQMTFSSGAGVIVSFTLQSEWDGHKIEVWASKTYDGTKAGLSAFTKMQTVTNPSAWVINPFTVNLSALNLQNGNTFYVAFRNAQNMMGYVFLDNLLVQAAVAKDADMRFYNGLYYSKNATIPVKGTVFNTGSTPITSFNINYSVNGGAFQTSNFTGLNVASGLSYLFTINNVAYTTGRNTLKTVVGNVNGSGADGNLKNDTLTSYIYIIPYPTIPKRLLIEDHSGAWCGNCVRSLALADYLEVNRPNIITVVNHNQDVMEIADNITIEKELKIAGFPTMCLDRSEYIIPNVWPNTADIATIDAHTTDVVPVEVSIAPSYNSSTRVLTVKVTADFRDGGADGDLRINCFALEDSVNGGTADYDQHNYASAEPGPFHGLPDPVTGYKHRNVLRACLGGPWGSTGVIPASVTQGQTFQKTYTYTVPAAYSFSKIKLVGFVQRYSSDADYRQVINARKTTYNVTVTSVGEYANNQDLFNVYPNPSSDYVVVSIPEYSNSQIKISDCSGRLVKKLVAGSEDTRINMNELNKGVYFIEVITNKSRSIKKVVLL